MNIYEKRSIFIFYSLHDCLQVTTEWEKGQSYKFCPVSASEILKIFLLIYSKFETVVFVEKEELTKSIHNSEIDLTPCKQIINQEFFLVLLTDWECIYCVIDSMPHYFKFRNVPLWSSKDSPA